MIIIVGKTAAGKHTAAEYLKEKFKIDDVVIADPSEYDALVERNPGAITLLMRAGDLCREDRFRKEKGDDYSEDAFRQIEKQESKAYDRFRRTHKIHATLSNDCDKWLLSTCLDMFMKNYFPDIAKTYLKYSWER